LLGALAGARFGLNSFPTDWREGLKLKEELMSECEAFASIFVTNEAIASIEITPNP
jgi:ADP-ribosylglycohydrolase